MQRRPTPKQQSKPDNKKRVIVVVLLLLLLSATAAWAMWSREDPQMAKVRDMMTQIDDVPWDQRRKQFDQIRPEMEKLSDEQRDQLRAEGRQRWEEREAKEMKDFFAMTAEQQIADLDKRIDRMQEWQKKREKEGDRQRAGRGGRGGGGGRPRAQSFGKDANGSVGASARDKARLNGSNPENRAQRDEYRRMMAERMKQRGVAMPQFPGRGRG